MTFAADVWSFGGAQSILAEVRQRSEEVGAILGPSAASPLVVSPMQRTVGDIEQTITESAGTVTVTRLP